MAVSLYIVPTSIQDAKSFVNQHHRHHNCGRMQTGLFAVALADDKEVVGVAIVGRPVARKAHDGFTAEVTRLCVLPNAKNGCSKLYAACWRAARAMGYHNLITYTLSTEPGTSLVAAGWTCIGKTQGGTWSRGSRPRVDKHPTQEKLRWQARAVGE